MSDLTQSAPTEPTPTPTTPSSEPPAPTSEPAAEPTSLLNAEKVEAPEPFDAEKLTLPENFDKTGPVFTEFTELARETGITGAQAQKLVDFHVKHSLAAAEAAQTSWQQTQDQWVGEVKADKEIGNIDALRQTIAKVADNADLTDPGFKQALAFTGAGNHPAVLRTLYRWAKALGEGGPVAGGPAARKADGSLTTSGPASLAEAIYGPSGPHTGGPRLS